MSQVSHDSTWVFQNGVKDGQKNDTPEKNDTRDNAPRKKDGVHPKDFKVFLKQHNYNSLKVYIHEDKVREVAREKNCTNAGNDLPKVKRFGSSVSLKDGDTTKYKVTKNTKLNKLDKYYTTTLDNVFKNKCFEVIDKDTTKILEKNDNHKTIHKDLGKESAAKKRTWKKQNQKLFGIKTYAKKKLRRTNESSKRLSKCTTNSRVLILLMMLNVAGQSSAIDASSFSSGLTSRMIASFLGYPSTCTLGTEVRPCSLTISCWLRGGTRLRGCGGWLFSCCGHADSSTDPQANSIPSSDWKYKPSPPKLRQVPQRNGMPNNVFRRRVDNDVTQMDCGLPSSRILQKRIIGGREARFAEFPWQAHVRISEFQCGGVLVSRRYVATAAHCVSRAHTRDIAVWLGATDTSATHHPARKLGVIQKILHPLFQFRMTQPDRFDIALLKLSRLITYMSHILPICLPDRDMELRGRSGIIAGWGKTDASNGHTGTNLLRSATVPILSKEQCISWHQIKQISVEIHSEMICAGHSDGHQDACLGDSGGPLIVLDNGRYYLVGITSAGFGCGVDHQPGIYHNVKLTASWIRSVISPSVNYNDNHLN